MLPRRSTLKSIRGPASREARSESHPPRSSLTLAGKAQDRCDALTSIKAPAAPPRYPASQLLVGLPGPADAQARDRPHDER
jgi:hypothetical protein